MDIHSVSNESLKSFGKIEYKFIMISRVMSLILGLPPSTRSYYQLSVWFLNEINETNNKYVF